MRFGDGRIAAAGSRVRRTSCPYGFAAARDGTRTRRADHINEQLIYVDPATDPYSGWDIISMMSQNQDAMDTVIGPGNYDVGHVLGGRNGAGVAYLGVTCGRRKASAVSAAGAALTPGPVRVTAHELGHQFAAGHTFHGSGANCTGNRTA